ncbi:hypothetical protein ACHAXA_009625 [Cyclostephanos tholiformis]|uniref:Uncharacterized protein n=1 Tax=Cyclostephanos tholiformis TaxID=382380 RepID=A0ABD3R1B0_9STRA
MRQLVVIATILSLRQSMSYSLDSRDCIKTKVPSASVSSHLVSSVSRHYLRRKAVSIICSLSCSALFFPLPLAAKEQPTTDSDVPILKEATEALSSLLENWQKATIDCTFADVPRELLETKNKDKLLAKASEFALFDKSTSVVTCKRTNRIVRDYIGVTGKGPLVGAEKRLLRKTVVERVDPESLDEYFSAVEIFSQSLSRATTLSYTAGTADFDSMNNFAKGDENISNGSNLEQARQAIEEATFALKKAVALLVENS